GARCRREAVMDFDDLLWHSVRLLEEHEDVRERLAGHFRWVLVDEYQDTNLAQERLVELTAGRGGTVCVVGDDDQSIYRFRGASRASMDRFLATFPAAVTVSLGRNRRSSHRIVTAACRLVENNSERLAKPLEPDPDKELGQPVEIWRCATAEQEAGEIAAAAASLHAAGVPPPRGAGPGPAPAIATPRACAQEARGG